MNKLIIVIICIAFLLTGCYDYKELNSISIIGATELDKIDNTYIVKVQIINPQAPDKTTIVKTPFVIYTGKGKTIQEAYRNITAESSKYLYLNHLQILVINENLAKNDIAELIDFFMRNPSIRTEFYVLIGKTDNILNIIPPIGNDFSSNIKKNIEINNEYLGISNIVTFNEFINMYLNKNLEIVLPSIENINYNKDSENIKNTEKSETKSKRKLGTLAVFKDNKLQGYLSKEESITYNIIKNNIKNTILTYPCQKEKYATIEIIDSKANITTKNKEINIKVNMNANLNEIACKISTKDEKDIKKLEKLFEKKLAKTITYNINNIRNKYNSDIFGFLDIIYKYDYKTYKKIVKNWNKNIFKNIKINVNTDIKIVNKGNVLEAINEKN